MKTYNVIYVDKLTNEDVICEIQNLYFNNSDVKTTVDYSRKLNKLTRQDLLIEISRKFDDLVIWTEDRDLKDIIAASI